jgi:serine phosphatase RsbU (regulator of sigma subunit)
MSVIGAGQELERSDGQRLVVALRELVAAGQAYARGRERSAAVAQALAGMRAVLPAALVLAALANDRREFRVVAADADSGALVGELEGALLPQEALTEGGSPGPLLESLGERLDARESLFLPVRVGDVAAAVLGFLLRAPLDQSQLQLARLLADAFGLLVPVFAGSDYDSEHPLGSPLELVGEALATVLGGEQPKQRVAALAADVTGAERALLWLRRGQGLDLAASYREPGESELVAARLRAERTLRRGRPLQRRVADSLEIVLPLRLEPVGALEFDFRGRLAVSDSEIAALATFGGRLAGIVEQIERSRSDKQELDRTQTLLAFSAQATAELSLEHALTVAVERIAASLAVDRVAIYLREEEGKLRAAATRGLTGAHERVAERLLELSLGSEREKAGPTIDDVAADERLEGFRQELLEAGVETAVALPLEVGDEVIGLLALYIERGRVPTEAEQALLAALRGQIAIAVQNARLHERAMKLGSELEQALRSERQAMAQLRALYEVSRAFAQSLSLEVTLSAAARTIAELVGVDVVALRMPDERQETIELRALHIANEKVAESMRAILSRTMPFSGAAARVFREGLVLRLTPETAAGEEFYRLFSPFLEHGATAVVLPVATPKEVLAMVSLISLDPERPIEPDTIEMALSIVGQAALAIDNARLYEQQKAFADTMQQSLLPDYEPEIEGLDVGAAYAASARVEIGGDLYDFMVLDDGTLAVALGDVTGHGIDAAADMAMVKFVFRSLARRHPDPGDFLAATNEVVVEEVAAGKFVTMVYLSVDPARSELACASAGHPAPRLVHPDGLVEPLPVGGLALGIVGGQSYEEIRLPYSSGEAVVLYTDGVIEARRGRELYGAARLDDFLSRNANLGARALAEAVLDDCRSFAGGLLLDDCAVVVVRAR